MEWLRIAIGEFHWPIRTNISKLPEYTQTYFHTVTIFFYTPLKQFRQLPACPTGSA